VAERQSALLARWMNVGFIHGVMNTDNMSIAGETIDFGPCAFMEAYHPGTVFSSIDQHGRYAYANQPGIAQWNLARLAEAILPLLAEDEEQAVDIATGILAGFGASYRRHWLAGVRAKLGFRHYGATTSDRYRAGRPTGWRCCKTAASTTPWPGATWPTRRKAARKLLHALFADTAALEAWLAALAGARAAAEARPAAQRAQAMRQVNPRIIARNHRVEKPWTPHPARAISAPSKRCCRPSAAPLTTTRQLAPWAEPAPAGYTERYRTFLRHLKSGAPSWRWATPASHAA
jgi:uncharacterized protein YdiU (UPF0061 family)